MKQVEILPYRESSEEKASWLKENVMNVEDKVHTVLERDGLSYIKYLNLTHSTLLWLEYLSFIKVASKLILILPILFHLIYIGI